MKREELEAFLSDRGWAKDRYGHYRKEVNGRHYRFKISRIAARREVRVDHYDGSKSWVRLGSNYLRNLYITEARLLGGLRR